MTDCPVGFSCLTISPKDGINVDSTNLGPELLALAGVLSLLAVFKLVLKLIGKL